MFAADLTAAKLARFTHVCIDDSDFGSLDIGTKEELESALKCAVSHVGSYTGMDTSTELPDDMGYAIMTLAAEMYDNRQITEQYTARNKTVLQILDMYSTNLLPVEEKENEPVL